MIKGILGVKLGMTQLFKEDGEVIPVTLIQAGPCYITQKKVIERDGYEAVQISFGTKKESHVNKAQKGHFDKAGKGYFYHVKEMACDNISSVTEGDEIKVSDIFNKGEHVKVIGCSKGKGYQGVVKRHHFAGNPGAHGSSIHRSSGSIGSSADPSKVIKAKRMAGHMGNKKVTVKNLEIVEIKVDENLIAVKGAVPGARGQIIILKKQGE